MTRSSPSRSRLRRIAARVASLSSLRKGDSAWIQTSEVSTDLAGLISLELMKLGADSLIVLAPSWLQNAFLSENRGLTIPLSGKSRREGFRNSDLFISIDSWHKPFRARNMSVRDARRIAGDFVSEDSIMRSSNLRWMGLAYPCEQLAESLHMRRRRLEDVIFDAIMADTNEMDAYGRRVARLLGPGRKVSIRGPKGTQLSLRMSESRPVIESGKIRSRTTSVVDGLNIPCGEVFGLPIPGSMNGTLFCPRCIDPVFNKMIRNLEIPFKKGRIDLGNIRADDGQNWIHRAFSASMKIDRAAVGREGILCACELGVGINHQLQRGTGYPRIDEKMKNTIHIGVGDNRSYGGNIVSAGHWDFVSEHGASPL